MTLKPHGYAPRQQETTTDVKFKKYTRLTVGQLKYACNFTKVVSADRGAFTCPPLPTLVVIGFMF